MEPGRRFASGYGKLCGALDTVGVKWILLLFSISLPAQKRLKTEMHYLYFSPMIKFYENVAGIIWIHVFYLIFYCDSMEWVFSNLELTYNSILPTLKI